MSVFSKLFVSFLCLASIFVAGWSASKELSVQSVLGLNWNDRITIMAEMDGNVPVGLSARSLRNLVTSCAEMRYGAPLLRAEPDLLSRFEATCGKIAERVLQSAPTNARSLAMALLMAPEIPAAALQRAQDAAPYEPWPLTIRLWAIEKTKSLDAGLLTVAAGDFDRALETDWGRTLLARLYLAREEARPAILARAEASDARTQRAFLSAVTYEQRGGRALDFNRG